MKRNSFYTAAAIVILFITTMSAKSQVVISESSSATPTPSSMLDVQSTTKGILIPSMTQAQRDAIENPAPGLLVFQTDSNPGLYFNRGNETAPEWLAITLSGPQASSSNSGYLSASDYDYFSSISSPWSYGDNSTIYYGYSVGVGLSSDPAYRLHVTNNTYASATGATDGGYVSFIRNGANRIDANGLKIQCSTNAASTSSKLIGFFDNDGTSLGSIIWNGTSGSGASPAFATASDIRLKKNINVSKTTIDDLIKIKVVDFNWKDDSSGKSYTGFIAQDLFTVFPNAVIKPEDENIETWKIMKEELIPIIVKSIQDQQIIIKTQEEKIKLLEDRLNAIEKLLSK